MAKGSEQATWGWAGDVRHCDDCGKRLRIADVGHFHTDERSTRTIRCQICVRARVEAFIAETRRQMGLAV